MTQETDSEAVELRNALRETSAQRDDFRKTAEQLTNEVMRLRDQVGAYDAQMTATERAHNEMRSQMAAKIEQAEIAFSQDMLTKEDLEAMRLQIVEQAEAPWREKVRSLEGELAAAHEAANAQRREAERARSALESAAIESRAALRDAEVRHGTQAAELSAKLELLEASRSAGASGAGAEEQHERTRRLQREHAEATVRSRKLLEEVEELRRENDGLLSLRSELLQANAALQGEAKANARLASSEKQSLERRIQHLQSELEASTAAQQRMHESQLHQEQEM